MLEQAKQSLTEQGLIDKFELVCSDILDVEFKLPEQVDCVVLSYAITTFIDEYPNLVQILR